MGGKSRKSGGVSAALIAKLKSGYYTPPISKKDDTKKDPYQILYDEESDDRD